MLGVQPAPSLRVPILSFSHTNFTKCASEVETFLQGRRPLLLRYRGACLPSMASSLSTDKGTQQFTNGSQLCWLWSQGTEVIQVCLQTTP